ncbi:MAG TPA: DUF5320 domain-containing protein [Firmicutes bacterium]|nr:DUF5320 domain-containing protein [Candidatus Fermentithermobacillaceae bacterium]
MPRFDGTGPQGNGPGTGRKAGICPAGFWGRKGGLWYFIGASASGIARRFFGGRAALGYGARNGRRSRYLQSREGDSKFARWF